MLCNYCHVEFPVGFSVLDHDQLKALLTRYPDTEAKSSHKSDIEDCKLFFIECITFHGMISAG